MVSRVLATPCVEQRAQARAPDSGMPTGQDHGTTAVVCAPWGQTQDMCEWASVPATSGWWQVTSCARASWTCRGNVSDGWRVGVRPTSSLNQARWTKRVTLLLAKGKKNPITWGGVDSAWAARVQCSALARAQLRAGVDAGPAPGLEPRPWLLWAPGQ